MRFRFHFRAALALVWLFLLLALTASAQIMWEQEYRGKTIGCAVSGLHGFGDSCGFEYYDAAFVGRILSYEELPGDEFRLVVSPTEVFNGELPATVKLTTRSGACMPEFIVGQQWLFSAKHDKKPGEFVLWFGSPGGPLPKSEEQVEHFRRLAQLKNSGLIVGDVTDATQGNDHGAGHKVIVRGVDDGVEHVTFTNTNGHFEFPPLLAGKYMIGANTIPGLWVGDGGATTVEAHGCRNYQFSMQADGSIAGSVILPDGDTTRTWNIDAVAVDDTGSSASSAFTDDAGHFQLRGLSPGRYLIGIEVVGTASRYDLNFGVYAPGVRDRVAAVVIDLGKNEKRTGVDIHLPNGALKPLEH
jgi:hypothetical protein